MDRFARWDFGTNVETGSGTEQFVGGVRFPVRRDWELVGYFRKEADSATGRIPRGVEWRPDDELLAILPALASETFSNQRDCRMKTRRLSQDVGM